MPAYKVKPVKQKNQKLAYYHKKSQTAYAPKGRNQQSFNKQIHKAHSSYEWAQIPPIAPVMLPKGLYHMHKAKSIIRQDNNLNMRMHPNQGNAKTSQQYRSGGRRKI